MTPWTRRLAPLVLLLATACGASDLIDPPRLHPCPAYNVWLMPVPEGEVGHVFWADCTVRIDPSVIDPERYSPSYAVAVLAHEYWHAAGWEDHLDRYSASPISTNYPFQGVPPSAAELERMAAVEGPVLLHVRDAVLLDAARQAAIAWNDALGRELFVVVDATS